MCGRYAASRSPDDLVVEFEAVRAEGQSPLPADYNVAPTKDVYVVRHKKERDAEGALTGGGHRELRAVRWGLVPSWAKDVSVGNRMLNARVESLTEKPAFKKAAASRRCLVPADGWFEWRRAGKEKEPFYMTAPDDSSLAFGGIWESWRPKDDDKASPLITFSIITTDAAGQLTDVHHRMPLIVPRSHWDGWLDPDREDVTDLLVPTPEDIVASLELRPVSSRVNNVRNNGPELLERVDPAQGGALFDAPKS